jgi:hypothetical protein
MTCWRGAVSNMRKTNRHDIAKPDYYLAPTFINWRHKDTMPGVAWDMDTHWMTASEWLAWVKRRDGVKTRWDGKRWRYPMRPQIEAGRMPYSTLMARRIPRAALTKGSTDDRT